MRVRIKQLVGEDKWRVQKREWYHLWWVNHDWFYGQSVALAEAKLLQSPVIIEIVPINKPVNKTIHYTTGE